MNPYPRINRHFPASRVQNPVTAVFDIGKTNKKFLLFDQSHSIVYQRQEQFEETEDEDGFPCEDLEQVAAWLFDVFHEAGQNSGFEISALNVSAYGASLVHLDEEGTPVTPLYNYLKPFPVELQDEFYETYGGRAAFSLETASPPMGMLNSGLQLYWLKRTRPERFGRIRRTLHFPQYLSYLFTGRMASEKTSIGCHTAMWNFRENRYHRWLKEEGIEPLLPEPGPVTTVYPADVNGRLLQAGPGIHDSSAALAPYLLAFDEPFIQLSTGTWSIALNPFSAEAMTFGELERDCLLYMNIYGKPVKASRFFMGNEYDHQINKMSKWFGVNGGEEKIRIDPAVLQKLVQENSSRNKLQLETAHTSGPYPQKESGNWDLSRFETFDEAYHQLMLDLVSIQADALRLAAGSGEIGQVIVTGGFSRNDFFARLLASFVPKMNVYTAATSHASAYGAALVAGAIPGTGKRIKEQLGLRLHKPVVKELVDGYAWASRK